jgi:serpin B
LIAANNEFGFNLFNQLRRQEADKNVFLSPLSVATALEMTYNGAAGETERAMARTLKLDGISLAEINQASAELMKSLSLADPKIELAVANSLWARQGVRFKEDFLARNRQFFGAEVASLDFASPQAVAKINGWVSANTKGKIAKIIDRIDAQQVMFLINAVYFKGLWQRKFDKTLTKTEPFHLLGGGQKPMPMMSQSGSYRYLRGEKFQALSLPYGKGGVSLYLFLPDRGLSLNDFLKSLSYQKWEQWMGSFRNTPGDVKIPRFKLDYERQLNDPLKALGMEVAFTAGRADFSGMRAERDLFISEVKHKAIVEVNEEGTEAAAATSVGISVTSVRPTPQRFTFIADRPFLMAICDERTGTILFMGAVMEPK